MLPEILFTEKFTEKLLENVDKNILLNFLKNSFDQDLLSNLFKGFQVNEKSLSDSLVIKRIAKLFHKDEEFVGEMVAIWLKQNIFLVELLHTLSTSAVQTIHHDLEKIVGPFNTFLSLLLDKRETIREIAEKLTEDKTFWENEKEKFPQDKLAPSDIEIFLDTTTPILDFFCTYLPVPPKPSSTENYKDNISSLIDTSESINQQIKELKKENEKLKKEMKKLNEKILEQEQQADQRAKQLKENLNTLKVENRNLKQEIENKIENIKKLEAQIINYKQEIEKKHSAPFSISAPPEEKSGMNGEDIDFADQVKQALSIQEEYNKKFGAISTIVEELKNIDNLLGKVKSAITNAVEPAPELLNIQHKLEEKKLQLLSMPRVKERYKQVEISKNKTTNDLLPQNIKSTVQQLHNSFSEYSAGQKITLKIIETTPSSDNLDTLQRTREEIYVQFKNNKLSEEEKNNCLNHLEKRIREIMEILCTQQIVKTPKLENIQNLSAFLKRKKSIGEYFSLFIDGYNIIKTIPSLREIENQSFPGAREYLISLLGKKLDCFAEVFLVFDGIDDFSFYNENLGVIYTNKHNGITADDYIKTRIANIYSKPQSDNSTRDGKKNILLSTADWDIIQNSAEALSGVIDPFGLYEFLKR